MLEGRKDVLGEDVGHELVEPFGVLFRVHGGDLSASLRETEIYSSVVWHDRRGQVRLAGESRCH